MHKGEIVLLKDSAIHELSNDMSYRKGCRYFKDGRVAKLLRRPGTSIYVATVEGSEDYEVRVRLDKAGEKIEAYDCTCPAAALYNGACKHVVALLKLIQAGQLEEEGEGSVASVPYQKPVGRIFDCFARAKKHAHLNAPPPFARRPSSLSRTSSSSATTVAPTAGWSFASDASGSTSCAVCRSSCAPSSPAHPSNSARN